MLGNRAGEDASGKDHRAVFNYKMETKYRRKIRAEHTKVAKRSS